MTPHFGTRANSSERRVGSSWLGGAAVVAVWAVLSVVLSAVDDVWTGRASDSPQVAVAVAWLWALPFLVVGAMVVVLADPAVRPRRWATVWVSVGLLAMVFGRISYTAYVLSGDYTVLVGSLAELTLLLFVAAWIVGRRRRRACLWAIPVGLVVTVVLFVTGAVLLGQGYDELPEVVQYVLSGLLSPTIGAVVAAWTAFAIDRPLSAGPM